MPKKMISMKFEPDLLDRIDAAAKAAGKDRTTFMADAVVDFMERIGLKPEALFSPEAASKFASGGVVATRAAELIGERTSETVLPKHIADRMKTTTVPIIKDVTVRDEPTKADPPSYQIQIGPVRAKPAERLKKPKGGK